MVMGMGVGEDGVIPSMYDGVHLCALSMEFASTMERLLWKTSCCFMVAVAGCMCFFHLGRNMISEWSSAAFHIPDPENDDTPYTP